MKCYSSSTEHKPKRMKNRSYDHHFSKRTGTIKRKSKNTPNSQINKKNKSKEKYIKDIRFEDIHFDDKERKKIYRKMKKSDLVKTIKYEMKKKEGKYKSYEMLINQESKNEEFILEINCENILNQKKGIKVLALILNKKYIPQELSSHIISNCLNNINIESDIYKILPDNFFISVKKIEYDHHSYLKHIKRYEYLKEKNPALFEFIKRSFDPSQRFYIYMSSYFRIGRRYNNINHEYYEINNIFSYTFNYLD